MFAQITAIGASITTKLSHDSTRARTKIFALFLFCAMIAALGACSPSEKSKVGTSGAESGELATETGPQKTLRIPLADDVKTLDPANAYDSVSLKVLPLALESLFQYSYLKRPMQLEPLLAESMPTVSKDGLTYTIKIKQGVQFQDDEAFPDGKGRELVATDFIYQWQRLLHPDLRSNGAWIFEDKVKGYNELREQLSTNKDDKAKIEELLRSEIPGFKALDKYTIQVQLTREYPQLLFVLAMGFCVPVPHEVTAKYGHDGLNGRMIGTGPYVLSKLIRGSKIVLEKNPNFRKELYPSEGDAYAKENGLLADAGKQLPFVHQITFNVMKEESPMWLQFNKGNLDIGSIPKDSFDSAISQQQELTADLANKGIQLQKYNRPVIWYLNFNMKDKLIGRNAYLRKAIAAAIDRDYMIKIFLNGRGVKATSMIPPGIAGHVERDAIVGDYDLTQAKEYLKLAGYPDGANLPAINFDLRGANTTSRQQGEYIKKALSKINVKVKVIANTFPAYLEKEKNGNLQFFIGGWAADYPDAENFLQLLYSKNVAPGPNASNWQNEKFDDLYLQIAKLQPNDTKKVALVKQAEDIAFKDGVWSMLYYPIAFIPHHGWVKNYRATELINNDLKYVDISLEQRDSLLQAKF